MEAISFDLYNVFMLFGIFQGLLLISFFVFNKNFRKKSNYALVLWLTFLVLINLGNVLEDIKLSEQYPFIEYMPFYNLFLLPIGLYYFAIFIIDSNYEFKQKDYWLVTPLFIQVAINFGIFFFYLINPDFVSQFKETLFLYHRFAELLMHSYLLYVHFFTLKKVNLYHRQLFNNYSEVEGKSLYWLRNMTIFLLLAWPSNVASQIYIFFYKSPPWIFYFNWFGASIAVYWLSYFILLRRDFFEIPSFQDKEDPIILKSTLSDKTDEHYQKLLELLQQEKLYQNAQLSMDTLAEKTGLSNGYLSKIINQKEGKNFYDFINTYRVEEVKLNLSNPNYAHYSILGIGLEAGFKSKSTFNAVFKKMTGMTPSAYKKSLS